MFKLNKLCEASINFYLKKLICVKRIFCLLVFNLCVSHLFPFRTEK